MMENRPRGHRFHYRLLSEIEIITVGEQITAKQLIEKRKVMMIFKAMMDEYRHHVRVK